MNETLALLDHWGDITKTAPVVILFPWSGLDAVEALKTVIENRNLRAEVRNLSAINLQLKAIIDSGNKPGFLYWVTRSDLLTPEEKRLIMRRLDQSTDIDIFAACNEAVEENARGYERMAQNVEARRPIGR